MARSVVTRKTWPDWEFSILLRLRRSERALKQLIILIPKYFQQEHLLQRHRRECLPW